MTGSSGGWRDAPKHRIDARGVKRVAAPPPTALTAGTVAHEDWPTTGGGVAAPAQETSVTEPALNDPAAVRAQYATPDNLQARIRLHRDFSVNPQPFAAWVFDHVDLVPGAAVLEVGCGPGGQWRQNRERIPPDWRVVLTDLSPAMVAEARHALAGRAGVHTCVADAQDPPVADGAFDIVFAHHMLYHVPDLPRTLAALRRVLRPGGTLYAATNGDGHLREMADLVEDLRPGASWRSRTRGGFSLDGGERDLAPHFEDIRCWRFDDEIRVTTPEPVLDYVASSAGMSAVLRSQLRARIQARIDAEGCFRIGKDGGLFAATAPTDGRRR